MLWFENHTGVNIRYSENTPVPEYHYTAPDFALDPAKVHTLIGCWQYQCAEYDGYDTQPGYALTERLRTAIEAKLGGEPDERGPWGIDSLEEARLGYADVADHARHVLVTTMQKIPHWTPITLVQALAEAGLLIMDPLPDEDGS
jgi:hypothetical protein